MKGRSSRHKRKGALRYAASKTMLRGRERVSILAAALQLYTPQENKQNPVYFYFSAVWVFGRAENTKITYLLLFHPLVPHRQDSKQHQHLTERPKDWLPRDGEQLQPVFTLLVRWTAVASAALLPPSLPDRTLPAPQQQLISHSAPRQQQRRSPKPPEERSPAQGQRKEIHAENVRTSLMTCLLF